MGRNLQLQFTELDVSIEFELGNSVSDPLKFLSFDLLSVPKCVVFFRFTFYSEFFYGLDSYREILIIERFELSRDPNFREI